MFHRKRKKAIIKHIMVQRADTPCLTTLLPHNFIYHICFLLYHEFIILVPLGTDIDPISFLFYQKFPAVICKKKGISLTKF